MTVYIDTPEGADSALDLAARKYSRSMRRAILMTQLKEMADHLNTTGDEEDDDIAHLIRCLWIAIHQKRVTEMYNLISDVVDGWIDESQAKKE